MIKFLQKINWGSANNLIFSPILFLIFIILLFGYRKRKTIAHLLCAPKNFKKFLIGFSKTKALAKFIFNLVGFIFLFVALLSPQWGENEENVEQEGRDLFIALDVSRSMLAKDLKPDRLEFAKQKIKRLLEMLSAERVGLILFSGSTFIQCPLTTDYSSFFMYLDQIDAETISSGTTALDAAIKKALEAFKKSSNERKNKLLVLFTDGEDFSSNLRGVKQEAIDQGMTIFAVGVGTPEGAPVPILDKEGNQVGNEQDSNGRVVISRLNEGILSNLAKDSGGIYIRAIQNDSDLSKIVKGVSKFEKERFENKKVKKLQEQYPWFVMVSFVCFLIEWLL
ncbi:MAG: von Willebrand factor type A [candidate division TM6 bacterium GW2011_GWF2_32_72]|nr:MAG: von Willebrand factor type A [candidate division TM6 bacterium GW2011_GWF2_32_72]